VNENEPRESASDTSNIVSSPAPTPTRTARQEEMWKAGFYGPGLAPTLAPTPTAQEKKWATEEKRRAAAAEKKRASDNIEARRVFAQLLENGMLSKGMDMHVTATGKGRKRLQITYVLANRAFVYREVHDEAALFVEREVAEGAVRRRDHDGIVARELLGRRP
jgi:hypothetical protein